MNDLEHRFDEILWIDGEGDIFSPADDEDVMEVHIEFADGSMLDLIATTPTAPQAKTINSGAGESSDWASDSTAFRMSDRLLEVMRGAMPEREKMECPVCYGECRCPYCEGKGCVDCSATGMCGTCEGRGSVLAE